MESVRKIETTMAGWYKNAPHLPVGGQKWLADNVWWLVIIGVILGALAFFGVLSAAFLGSVVLIGLAGPVGAAIAGVAFIAVLLSLTSLAIITALMAMAITPLKERRKKGWELLFIGELIYIALSILGVLFGDLSSIVGALLGAAIGFYLLFEIRGHFGAAAKTIEQAEDKKATPKEA